MAPTMSPGPHEDGDYHFPREHADAIVQTTSYHNKDYDMAVIWFPESLHQSIRPSISTSFPRSPSADLGILEGLPRELLNIVIRNLDMKSLTNCRQVNLRLRQAIDLIPEYQVICTHALNTLCALLRTWLADIVSLSDFYRALCTKNCDLCSNFAGFISLPIWRRCCYGCLERRAELKMQTARGLRSQLGLSDAQISKMTEFETLPGKYTESQSFYRYRVHVVPVEEARRLCDRVMSIDCSWQFLAACALPYYDEERRTTENGISCAGCWVSRDSVFVTTVHSTGKTRDHVYEKDEFLEHFNKCPGAQVLWESSREGTIKPPGLPEIARSGGWFESRE
ncbi:hypothetical protein V492_03235 [Pseudogymnoascus sp. VKM F-4246]|nr:hypothetical protein V492_03235 [Pseudogymnoascus sp. VKM F-4246]